MQARATLLACLQACCEACYHVMGMGLMPGWARVAWSRARQGGHCRETCRQVAGQAEPVVSWLA